MDKLEQMVELFTAAPRAVETVEQVLVRYCPHVPTTNPVTLKRHEFDALCMAALVGLEASSRKKGASDESGT